MSRLRRLTPLVLASLAMAAPSAAHAATGDYYLALGDSLAAGIQSQPSLNGGGYVSRLAAHLQSTDPGIQVKNVSCSGATTTSLVSNQTCDSTFSGTQLQEAEAFLSAHPGHVPLVTIDIGGNDVDGCVSAGGVDGNCVSAGFAAIDRNVARIVSGLAAAAGSGTRFAMMTYYDPFLEEGVAGSGGQALALQSVPLAGVLNTKLVNDFGSSFVVADVARAFSTADTSDLVSTAHHGVVPQDVAVICQLTGGCDYGFNVHANSLGHQLIADTFFAALTGAPELAPAGLSAPGVSGLPVQGQSLTETHGAWTNSPVSFGYQWIDCNAAGAACAPIAGATGPAYSPAVADVGRTLRVQEAASNPGGTGAAVVSSLTGVVQAAPVVATAPSDASPPLITGTPTVGRSLAASPGTWSGRPAPTFSYQWQRCHRACARIAKATGPSYRLGAADRGARILVTVTATSSAGSASASSSERGPVSPSAAQVRRLLSAELVPGRGGVKIAELIRAGGYRAEVKALGAGRATLAWYLYPHGTRSAPGKASKGVLVARGTLRFTHAGRGRLKLKLTPAGKRVLKVSEPLKLTAVGKFALPGQPAISVQHGFALRR